MRRPHTALRARLRARAGFTLIEVLASLFLIGLVVPVALGGISLAVGLASSAKHQREAATLAASKLAEMTATGSWQLGDATGDFAPDWPDYRWDVFVSDWQDPLLNIVEVRVRWTAKGTEHSVSLTTLVPSGST